MPEQQTDTIRVLPVGQPDNRDTDPLKDQIFRNCFVESVANPYSGTKNQWLFKRPGLAVYLDLEL